ncbi:hypothetical protein ACEN2J_11580 [Pseudorhodobacter sp. W20_MBD10_FR17]|uniref:hypothetical protein n=1 Tax=Pseudorhodobacter sp. W20_MBD10_FR17 TaxID=3240266 RepID=UPI003F950ECE
MDTRPFVLSVSVFMVLVTAIMFISQWEYKVTPQKLVAFACKFDSICRGSDCRGPLPADIVILPVAEDGRAYYFEAGFETGRNALETVSETEWVMRTDKTGMRRFQLRENGALTVTETDGFAADSTVLGTATGFCVDADRMNKGQA